MLPIADSDVTGPTVSDPRVLKVKFNVSGNDTNPKNTIYDQRKSYRSSCYLYDAHALRYQGELHFP